MEKYGFDYYIERASVINEMAKPNEFGKMGESNPDFAAFNNNVYKPLLQKMAEYGHLDKTKAAQKAIMYLSTMIADLPEHDGAYRDFVKSFVKENLDKYQAWLNGKGDNSFQQTQFVLVQLVKEHIQKFQDQEFVERVFDPENIANYAQTNRISKISNRSQGMGREVEKIYDLPIEELDKLRALAAPVERKLGLAAGGRTRSINKLGDKSKYLKKGVDPNSPQGVAATMLDVFEEILETKRDVMASVQSGRTPTDDESYAIMKFPEEEIIKMVQYFQQRVNSGKGITLDQVYSGIIDPLVNHGKNNPSGKGNPIVQAFGEIVQDNIEAVLDPDTAGGIDGLANGGENTSGYGPYDPNIVHALLDAGKLTPEEVQALKQWLPYRAKYQELRKMKSDSKGIGAAANKFLQGGEKEESEEDQVGGYMSEQTWKDSKTHQRGKFVERGFKKAKNYNHWISLNG